MTKATQRPHRWKRLAPRTKQFGTTLNFGSGTRGRYRSDLWGWILAATRCHFRKCSRTRYHMVHSAWWNTGRIAPLSPCGGLFGKVEDQYRFSDWESTRCAMELTVLKALANAGVECTGSPLLLESLKADYFYRADLMSERIPNAKDLVDVLVNGLIDADIYRCRIGWGTQDARCWG